MTEEKTADDNLGRLGKTISTILIGCLAAFFLYGYIPHFLG